MNTINCTKNKTINGKAMTQSIFVNILFFLACVKDMQKFQRISVWSAFLFWLCFVVQFENEVISYIISIYV